MADRVAEFRRVAAGKRKLGRRARYGNAMRKFALGHAAARMSAGASVQTVATELGLTGQTLSNWLRRATRAGERPAKLAVPAKLVPVRVKGEPRETPRGPIVIVAGEIRVEVSDVETAAELVRSLQ